MSNHEKNITVGFRRFWNIDILKGYTSTDTSSDKTRTSLAQELIRSYEENEKLELTVHKLKYSLDKKRKEIGSLYLLLEKATRVVELFDIKQGREFLKEVRQFIATKNERWSKGNECDGWKRD